MEINLSNTCGLDIIWYGVDSKGEIAQFITGGCCLIPKTSMVSLEDLDILVDFFEKFENKSKLKIMNTNHLREKTGNKNITKEKISKYYSEEFIEISEKGIYSFDANTKKQNGEYFKISYPVSPINIKELPENIQKLLKYFKLDCNFENLEAIMIEENGVQN